MRVKEILKEKGMTSKDLAGILGMSETGLSLAISEKGNPSLSKMRQIADALGVPVEQLLAAPSKGVNALVECDGKFYKATSAKELRRIADEIESLA